MKIFWTQTGLTHLVAVHSPSNSSLIVVIVILPGCAEPLTPALTCNLITPRNDHLHWLTTNVPVTAVTMGRKGNSPNSFLLQRKDNLHTKGGYKRVMDSYTAVLITPGRDVETYDGQATWESLPETEFFRSEKMLKIASCRTCCFHSFLKKIVRLTLLLMAFIFWFLPG